MRAIYCAILALVTWEMSRSADEAGSVITSGFCVLVSIILLCISGVLCIKGL